MRSCSCGAQRTPPSASSGRELDQACRMALKVKGKCIKLEDSLLLIVSEIGFELGSLVDAILTILALAGTTIIALSWELTLTLSSGTNLNV